MADKIDVPNRDDLLSDPRLTMLLDASVDAIVVLGNNLEILWANPGTERLLGWPLEEFKSMDILSLLHPDDLEQSAVMLDRMMGGIEDDPPRFARLKTSNGSQVWVEIMGSDLRDVPGIDGIVLTARDITNRFELEEALRGSQRRFESLVRHSNDGIVVLDEEMRLTYVSPAVEILTGYSPDSILGADASTVVMEPQRTELVAAFDRVLSSADVLESLRVRVKVQSGDLRWFEVRVSNRIHDPDVAGVIANLRDITDMVIAEVEASQLTEIFDLTDDLVIVVNDQSVLQYMNPAFARFLGLSDEEIPIGSVWKQTIDVSNHDDDCIFGDGQRRWATDVMFTRGDGVQVPFALQVIAHHDVEGAVCRYSAVAHDISERYRLAESLRKQARHDPLTGLPNRVLLEQRMRQIGDRDNDASHNLALLFIDLDHFKVINDSLGHEFGDKLLRAVADRLVTLVRPQDTVARFGGDEFVVLCDGLASGESATSIARRVTESMMEPVLVDGNPVHVSVSVGIAESECIGRSCDPGALVRDADTAMYQAKSEGRGRVVVFDEHLRRRAVERQSIEIALRNATVDGSLELHYQPIVEMESGRLVTMEALIRWNRDGELISPDDFIPVAEETGLIVPIGAWVLNTACEHLARCQAMPGWQDLRMSVNVSARQLHSDGLVDLVSAALARTGVSAESLMLEITESVLLEDIDRVAVYLDDLRSLGVHFAIDDFGTGFSSLTYLDRLPADVVKLDRTFLESAASDRDRNRLVAGVVGLIRTIELSCVAEGIESEEQYQLLAGLGCARGQGYYISRPLQHDDVIRRLGELRASEPWPRGQWETPTSTHNLWLDASTISLSS
ncbi:MAG: EAL domain-containing protein [Microthrixaceae bacterium]|nr:EAL domain-containing protein [Microthrixaceae bacterium]